MDDLISRRAAIDAINKAFERVFAWDGTSPLGDKVLENVPSAQPEQIARDIATIIENEKDMRVVLKNAEHMETHSCDCEHTETHESRREWYMHGYRDAQRWIPVTEALPEKKTEVIYSLENHFVSTGYMTDRDYKGDEIELHWEDMESGALIYPEAWMPLPEPYTSGADMRGTE